MLPLEALNEIRPLIATPAFGASCFITYTGSLAKLTWQFGKLGIDFRAEFHSDSLITRARARLLAEFLLDESRTHLFWVDADIEFTPSAFIRLLLADRDVVCGVYPLKRFDWPQSIPENMTREQFEARYTPYPVGAVNGKLVSDEEGFGEVEEATTGFMCIKRKVIEDMVMAYPELKFAPDDFSSKEIAERSYLLFDTMKDSKSGRLLSEDYAFCHRWRSLGGKVWVDIHSKLNHYGQNNWKGDLYASLKAGGVRQ